MLNHYLQKAVEDLEVLIELTSLDIEDIKLARHDEIFGRIETKESTLRRFENTKMLIENEISALLKSHPDSDLSELLDETDREGLQFLRENLEKLQMLNRYYARFVIAVGEFYNSMYEEIFPVEKDGYTANSPKIASLIELRV